MSSKRPRGARTYGVKLVRGPFVKLTPHPEHVGDTGEFLSYAARLKAGGQRLAADLFSGAGGLSLGLENAGFRVVLSSDHDSSSVETHRHHFGGLSLDWDLSDPTKIAEVARLVEESGVELLAGGPPCQPFSRAGRSKLRHRVEHGLREPHDERRDLWRSFLEVVQLAKPPAVLMENVPEMALDREMFILRSVVEELEQLGYSVEERVVETRHHGVPQFRQRLILVALRDSIQFTWPAEQMDKVRCGTPLGISPKSMVDGAPMAAPTGGASMTAPSRRSRRTCAVTCRRRTHTRSSTTSLDQCATMTRKRSST